MQDFGLGFSLDDAFHVEEKYMEIDIKSFKLYIVNVTNTNVQKLGRELDDIGKQVVLPANEIVNNQLAIEDYLSKYPYSIKEGYVEDLIEKTYGLEELILSKYLAVKQ